MVLIFTRQWLSVHRMQRLSPFIHQQYIKFVLQQTFGHRSNTHLDASGQKWLRSVVPQCPNPGESWIEKKTKTNKTCDACVALFWTCTHTISEGKACDYYDRQFTGNGYLYKCVCFYVCLLGSGVWNDGVWYTSQSTSFRALLFVQCNLIGWIV